MKRLMLCLSLILVATLGAAATAAGQGPRGNPPAAPIPTATPIGWRSVTLQAGADGYVSVSDTWINGWSPMTHYGNDEILRVRSGEWMHGLLQFDLSEVPDDAKILEARLTIWCIRQSNPYAFDVDVHEVTTAWDEDAATWLEARSGVPWQTAGGDYAPQILDSVHIDQTARSYTFDVTGAVERWIKEPAANHGLMLRSATPYGVEYQFTTSEHVALYARPRLEIFYRWFPLPAPTFIATPVSISMPTPQPVDEWH